MKIALATSTQPAPQAQQQQLPATHDQLLPMLHPPANSRVKGPQDFGYKKATKATV